MRGARTKRKALLEATAALLLAAPAHALSPPPPPVDQAPLAPPTDDTVKGHTVLAAGPSYSFPAGSLDSRRSFSSVSEPGPGLTADLGHGVGDNVMFGVYFDYENYGRNDYCSFSTPLDGGRGPPGCRSSSFSGGPMLRYHLAPGSRFDPWAAVGAGYRYLSLQGPPSPPQGLELRLRTGGDWYALGSAGFGPYMDLALGSFLNPYGLAKADLFASFSLGLRASFDLPGR